MATKSAGLIDGVFITEDYAIEAFRKFYSEDTHICEIVEKKGGYIYHAKPLKSKVLMAIPANLNTKPMYGAMLKDKQSEELSDDDFWLYASGGIERTTKSDLSFNDPTFAVEEVFENEQPLIDVSLLPIVEDEAIETELEIYNEEEEVNLSELNETNSNHHCTYCGDNCSGLQRDHVVSMSWRGGSRHYGRGHTVPCCPECNTILGDKAIHSIIERAAYLVEGIANRNRTCLNAKYFTEKELLAFDDDFRREVIYSMQDKVRVKRRINYAYLVAGGYYTFGKMKSLVKQGKDV